MKYKFIPDINVAFRFTAVTCEDTIGVCEDIDLFLLDTGDSKLLSSSEF